MKVKGRFHRLALTGVLSGVAVLGLATIPSISGASVQPHPSGTLTFPEVQNDWTFVNPFLPGSQFTASNAAFISLQDRPLYLFGAGNNTSINYTYSLANAPSFSNTTHPGKTTVTVPLKGWHWSNGETVNGASALFWINMEKWADNPANYNYSNVWPYGGYSPGVGIPDQVVSASASGNTLTIVFNEEVDSTWALDNALQVITPMPISWDKTSNGGAAGSGHCSSNATFSATAPYPMTGSVETDCGHVYNYLNANDGGTLGATSNAAHLGASLWRVSDGPWKLGTIVNEPSNIGGTMPTFTPNTAYSGTNRAQAAELKFVYFTSQTAEDNALASYTDHLTTGGVPANYTTVATVHTGPSPPSSESAGANIDSAINSHYATEIGSLWGFDYAYYNFTGGAPHQALLNQQYIRQALDLAVDQAGIDTTVYNGYAVPDCNPLPPVDDPYQNNTNCSNSSTNPSTVGGSVYNLNLAKSLLTSHGWNINSTPATCTSGGAGSGNCGAGISTGDHLIVDFAYVYSAGSSTNTQVADMDSEWAAIGAEMNQQTFTTSTSLAGACFVSSPTYDVCWYGGWVYNPGVFVSGEQLLLTGAGSNENGFSNATVDCSIKNTIELTEPSSCTSISYAWTTNETTALHNYANFTGFSGAGLAPLVYVPDYLGPSEVNRSVTWTGPASAAALGTANKFSNPVDNFLPEFMRP
jgi:peptide/nickel transport system substrate-binding protein